MVENRSAAYARGRISARDLRITFSKTAAEKQHLQALRKKRLIESRAGTSRGIRLKDARWSAVSEGSERFGLPVVGKWQPGSPLRAQENVLRPA